MLPLQPGAASLGTAAGSGKVPRPRDQLTTVVRDALLIVAAASPPQAAAGRWTTHELPTPLELDPGALSARHEKSKSRKRPYKLTLIAMEFIYVEPESLHTSLTRRKGWCVTFEDDNGWSILSRQKTKKSAEKRAAYFRKELTAGRLLREDPSVWE